VASLPHVAAEALFGTSLALHRGLVLAAALAALAAFGLAIRRLFGSGTALLACAALAFSFGFYSASHWVRWDGIAMLFSALILLALVAGPARLLLAAGVGALIGIAPDFALGVAGALPGALVLCAWERERRWERVGALLGGVAAGGLAFALLHFTGGWSDAQQQYEIVFRPIYGEVPLFEAIGDLSLAPLLDESDRYSNMAPEPFLGSFAVIAAGALAAVLSLLSALGVGRRPLAWVGVAALCLLGLALLATPFPHEPLRHLTGLLIATAFGLMLALGVRALLRPSPYPTEAVPAVMLASMLVGFGLLLGWKGPTYVVFCFPFAFGAIASALHILAPPRLGEMVPAVGLAVIALAGAVFLAEQIRAVPDREPALDSELAAEANRIVPEGSTVVGEWIYWWLWRDERFRFNSSIWLQQWQHPSEGFAGAFHRVCPDYVLMDDLWLARYGQLATGRRFASQAPTRRGEKRELLRLLRREYRPVSTRSAADRTLVFWERRAPGCPEPAR